MTCTSFLRRYTLHLLGIYLYCLFLMHHKITRSQNQNTEAAYQKIMLMPFIDIVDDDIDNIITRSVSESESSIMKSAIFSWNDIDTHHHSNLWNQIWNLTTAEDMMHMDGRNQHDSVLSFGAKEIHEGRVIFEFLPRILDRKQRQSDVLIMSLMKDVKQDDIANYIQYEALKYNQTPLFFEHTDSLNTWSENRSHRDSSISWNPLLLFVTSSYSDNGFLRKTLHVDNIFSYNRSIRFLNEVSPEYIVFEVSLYIDDDNVAHIFGESAIRTLMDANYKVQVLASTHFISAMWGPNKLFYAYTVSDFFVSAKSSLGSGRSFKSYLFATRGLDLAIPSRRPFLDLSKVCKGLDSIHHDRCGRYYKEEDDIYETCTTIQNETLSIHFLKDNIPSISHNGDKIELNDGIRFNIQTWLSENNEAVCATKISNQRPYQLPIVSCDTQIIEKPFIRFNKEQLLPNILWITLDALNKQQVAQVIRALPIDQKLQDIQVGKSIPVYLLEQLELSTILDLKKKGYATFAGANECKGEGRWKNPATHGGSVLNDLFCQHFHRPNCVGNVSTSDIVVTQCKQFIKTYSKTKTPWAAFMHLVDAKEDSLTLSHKLMKSLSSNPHMPQLFSEDRNNTIVVITSNGGISYGSFYRTHKGAIESNEPSVFMSSGYMYDTFNDTLLPSIRSVYEFVDRITLGSQANETLQRTWKSLGFQANNKEPRPIRALVKKNCSIPPSPPSVHSFYADISRNRRPYWPKCNGSRTKAIMNSNGILPKVCLCATDNHDWYECEQHPWMNHTTSGTTAALVSCFGSYHNITLDIRIAQNNALTGKGSNTLRGSKHHSRSVSKHFGNLNKNSKNMTSESDRFIGKILQNRRVISNQRPSILLIEVDSVSLEYAERHFPLTSSILKKHNIKKLKSGRYSCYNKVCSARFDGASVVGVNSIPNQIAELSGCMYERNATYSIDECFNHRHTGYQDDTEPNCVMKGEFFGKVSRTCRPCPPGHVLQHPTEQCYSDINRSGGKFCCTNNRRVITKSAICKNVTSTKLGLQLFKRVKSGDLLWCPIPSDKTIGSPWLFDIVKDLGYKTFFGEEFCYEDSPYVVQDLYFLTEPDYRIDNIYCRLATHLKREQKLEPRHPMWAVEHDRSSDPKPCLDGRSRYQIAHEYITKMWEAHPDQPKLAYLNAISAHDYGLFDEHLHLGAEAYDELLSKFLTTIMSSSLFENTVVVVRSDHGLQGGPAALEYSTQQEHAHPWSNVLFHESFNDISIDALVTNQDRLVTGYDLYKTLIGLIDGSFPSSDRYPVPTWSYNLFHEVVPPNRTCDEAKIPREYCPCEGDKSDAFVRPRFNLTQS